VLVLVCLLWFFGFVESLLPGVFPESVYMVRQRKAGNAEVMRRQVEPARPAGAALPPRMASATATATAPKTAPATAP
jgi:hypothetical protein